MMGLLATSAMLNAAADFKTLADSDTHSVGSEDSLFGTSGRRVSPSEFGAAKGDELPALELDSKLALLHAEPTTHAGSTIEELAAPVRTTTPTTLEAAGAPKDAMVVPAKEGSFTFTLASHDELMTELFIGKEAKGSLDDVFLSFDDVKDLQLVLPYSEDYIKHIIESQKGDNDSDDIISVRKAITDQLYPQTPLIGVVDRLGLEHYSFKLRGTDAQMAEAIVDHVADLKRRLEEAETYSTQYWTLRQELTSTVSKLEQTEREKAQAVDRLGTSITRLDEQLTTRTAELSRLREEARTKEQTYERSLEELRQQMLAAEQLHHAQISRLSDQNIQLVEDVTRYVKEKVKIGAEMQSLSDELVATQTKLEAAEQRIATLKDWIASVRDGASALLG